MNQLDRAYAACRGIAKREAKNFYYAFVALPRARRDAICAVYAFMRQADDIADDEALPIPERRRRLAEWTAAWKRAAAGEATTDLVFAALRDATRHFEIPLELLDQLIAGVAMDLDEAAGARLQSYATFDDLYRYCYLVASVVGLICIRIFGYAKNHGAERFAEETGVAFQLTNILRDVAEDAARSRVYLPEDLLAEHGLSVDDLLRRPAGQPPTDRERALFAAVARRAEGYYASARHLIPLIDRESRPALWVLVSIYHGLLQRIRRADYDVFSRRASVPRAQKIAILLLGQARMLGARVMPGTE